MARNKGGLRFQPSGGARGPAIPVGKKQRLTIERLAHDGRGIAHEADDLVRQRRAAWRGT